MKIRLTARAARQIDEILDYVAARSPQGAGHLKERFQDVVETLTRHAMAGQTTDRPGVRRIVMNPYPYVVFYRLRDDDIVIQRVRHAARRPLSS